MLPSTPPAYILHQQGLGQALGTRKPMGPQENCPKDQGLVSFPLPHGDREIQTTSVALFYLSNLS